MNTLTRDFFSTPSPMCTHHIVAHGVARRVCIKHVHPHVITCLSVCCFPCFCLLPLSLVTLRSLSLLLVLYSKLQLTTMSSPPSMKPKAHWPNEEYSSVAVYNPLTGYEPNQLDGFDCSEASAAIFQDESVGIDTELAYSCDAELDDELIEKALSSPLFIQEREEPANVRQTYHSHEESLLPAQSFFTRTSTGKPVHGLRFVPKTKIKSRNQDSLWKTKKSKFLLKSDLGSRSKNFKPSLIKEASRN